ncbi:MAG TPA: AAA family ATPase [Anaerolineae bacterium]|nr:AAA family ATPase [Anaerolineae bacterium]
MDLFDLAREERIARGAPLAARMRPRTLDEFAGQEHIVGPGRLLRRAIQADQLSSVIFYGPPGTGKTTLAAVIANTTRSHFETLNAVLAGVADVRRVTKEAQERLALHGRRTILFVDEVHRWNKAQQDALLPWVENGTVILIGATTENPYFSVNRPLVSRSRIFQFKPLTGDDLRTIAAQALADSERGYGKLDVVLHDDALDHLVNIANGDARGVLNALELAVETTPPGDDGAIVVDMVVAEESIQRRAVLYDKDGDYHYDTISAFIKSLRGSDPDAALYWLAKMVYAGEDPRFLFRRMLIFAGEDVGLADPDAVRVVNACAEVFDRVGLPEGRFHLAEAALYLATAPKSNSAFAFFDALAVVEKEREGEVPTHLRDGSRDKEGFGHGEGYLYPPAYRDHWVAQQYLPAALQGRTFYDPGDQGYERAIREQVARRREAQLAAMVEGGSHPEILTFDPGSREHDRWLQRTIDNAGERLGHVRDRVLDAAAIQRHHVVLDLHAGAGLLTWETLRRAPEGGTWALARDREAAEGLRQQAARLSELTRPVVLAGDPAELGDLLALRGEAELRFDAIVGRNALGPIPDKEAALRELAGWLRPGGRLSLAETLVRGAQRLYALVDLSALDEDVRARLVEAEEAIYLEGDDPLVTWDADDLRSTAVAAGLEQVEVDEDVQPGEMLIGQAALDRWFAPAGTENDRPSYASHLLGRLSPAELAAVERTFRAQLAGQTVPWRTRFAYLVARASNSPIP